MTLELYWSECLLSLSVSDLHKPLLLNNSNAIPHLLLNLFLDLTPGIRPYARCHAKIRAY
jgi:hypothetical protein